jgi:predicted O-methyltransferase YrrM
VPTLPQALRRLTPDRLRDDVRLRALGVGLGLIPPRTMHSEQDARVLLEAAAGARRAVEIGVYEGSSAVRLCGVLGPEAELHLIDPFGHHPDALRAGWAATERATRRVVARAARAGGPQVVWHVALSADVAAAWSGPADAVFIDGDHSERGCRADWDGWQPHVPLGGVVVFHDARLSQPDAAGLPGPTAVVDVLFRGAAPEASGWRIAREVDSAVAVVRERRAVPG